MTDDGPYEYGDSVKVTAAFTPIRGGEKETTPVGEIGRIDGAKREGRYLVVFPDASGWFIPPEKLESARASDRGPWWR